eukprot:gene14374-16962_t
MTPNITFIDNTAIISTHTTKSSLHRYEHSRPLTYGDSVVDGGISQSIVNILIHEILLAGLEAMFYCQSTATNQKIYNILNISDEEEAINGKLQFQEICSTDEEDKEIDSPPEKRPKISDIVPGVDSDFLSRFLAKDLSTYLRNKKLKYSDKKELLIKRILSHLEGSTATDESDLSGTDSSKVHKKLKV